MTNRRQFLVQSAAAASLIAATKARSDTLAADPKGAGIRSLILRDETILRHPTMNGDNWHLTWASDDRQYTSLCDGYGQFENPPGMYNSRLIAVEGEPQATKFHDVSGYPELVRPFDRGTRYYNFGVIALEERIYQFLSTWPFPLTAETQGLRFMGVKLIYSSDNGRTWHNQDGSTPVRWEDWRERSRESLLFFEEPQESFSMISVLQMGRGYAANRDGFVYLYAPNGNTEGTMNELVMLRVPKQKILDRGQYEYFAGRSARGGARWTREIESRAVVHTFPKGWVNKKVHPWAWIPSVAYNEPLGLYMMANWATAPGPEPDQEWFTKPSYLGFWTAPNPWGPWTQVYENTAWAPGGDEAARCYSPIIAPKWLAPDGKSFWLVWTDFQQVLSKQELAQRRAGIDALTEAERPRAEAELDRLNRPYYSFNLQRVDLAL